MAIEIQNDIIMSIEELSASLETTPVNMEAALKKAGITILHVTRRPRHKYITLRAVHEYLMRHEDGN